MKRVLTALVLALVAFYSIFLAPPMVFAAVVAAMAILCYSEFAGIAKANGVEGPLWLGYAAGLIAMWRPDTLPILVVVLLTASLKLADLSKVMGFVGTTALGAIYIFLAWRWAYELREINRYWLLFALSINWVGDIAAFYVGRSIGRHKLARRISPGKSWEGAIASMVGAVAFGLWYGPNTGLTIPALQFAGLAAVANVAGQIGDLVESALKRGAGVKDSGTLLPGHGGFMDRLDSSLFTLPVVYYFLKWINGG